MSDTVPDSLILAPSSIFWSRFSSLVRSPTRLFTANQFLEFPLVFAVNIAWLKKPMLKKICDPFSIFLHRSSVREQLSCDGHLPPWFFRRLKDIIQRLPIRGCNFHGDHFASLTSQLIQGFSGCCTKPRTSCCFLHRKQATISFCAHQYHNICRKIYPYWPLNRIYGTVLCLLSFYYTSFCHK